MPRSVLFALMLAFWPTLMPSLAFADRCHGQNLIAALPADQLATLQTKAEVPFAHGNLWQATKGGQTITLAGTYHLNDARFGPILDRLTPYLQIATTLLVEAGPDEEATLKDRMLKVPGLIYALSGPTLPEQMSEANWQRLSTALMARGMWPALAAKMRPWLLTTLLSMPPCMFPLDPGSDQGLDKRLMSLAAARGVPIKALEPYDTILGIFSAIPPADQLTVLFQAVKDDAHADDMVTTLAASYFGGESRLYWEWSRQQMLSQPGMTPAEAERQMALVEGSILAPRNKAWIPVLEEAAAKGPILAAFGALHLSGDSGVLNLLAERGWTVTPLKP